MKPKVCSARLAARALALVTLLLAGVVSIVGSGGVAIFPEGGYGGPFAPLVSFGEPRAIVAAGQPITLKVSFFMASPPVTVQWCRVAPGGTACVAIPGATSDSLTLASPSAADDAAIYEVRVSNPYGAASARIELWVSALPPERIADAEFNTADWRFAVETDPAGSGATLVADTLPAGGNPGAWRHLLGQAAAGPGTLRGTEVFDAAVYDPAVQGAIRIVAMVEDCKVVQGLTAPALVIYNTPLLEQGGRQYAAVGDWRQCNSTAWFTAQPRNWLTAASFTLVAGPPCGSGERCPDFTAAAAPLHFGLRSEVVSSTGALAQGVEFGVDNWETLVWRP